jgi:hypothetical protein
LHLKSQQECWSWCCNLKKALLLFLITIHDEVCVADAGLLQLKCSMMTDEKCKFVGQEKKSLKKNFRRRRKT